VRSDARAYALILKMWIFQAGGGNCFIEEIRALISYINDTIGQGPIFLQEKIFLRRENLIAMGS
jgi:hypothetical protein